VTRAHLIQETDELLFIIVPKHRYVYLHATVYHSYNNFIESLTNIDKFTCAVF